MASNHGAQTLMMKSCSVRLREVWGSRTLLFVRNNPSLVHKTGQRNGQLFLDTELFRIQLRICDTEMHDL